MYLASDRLGGHVAPDARFRAERGRDLLEAAVEFGNAELRVGASADFGEKRRVAAAGFQPRYAIGGVAISRVRFLVAAEAFIGARERQEHLRGLALTSERFQLFETLQRFVVAAELKQGARVSHQHRRIFGAAALDAGAPLRFRLGPAAKPLGGLRQAHAVADGWRVIERAHRVAIVALGIERVAQAARHAAPGAPARHLRQHHCEEIDRSAEWARVIFVTSGLAFKCTPYWGAYSVGKAGLEAIMRTYAGEMATTNVRTNCFSPGATRTKMRATAMPGEDPNTLPTPEEVTAQLVEMCVESFTANGGVFKFAKTGLFKQF